MCQLYKMLVLLVIVVAIRNSKAQEFAECNNVGSDSFVMVVDECAAYVYCNGAESFRDNCPAQTYFDPTTQECVFDDVGMCPQTTTEASVTPSAVINVNNMDTTVATTTTLPATRPHCEHSADSFHAHPQRCEYYYRCISGFLTIVRCPYNYGWDNASQQCLPLSEARCYSLSA